MNLARIAPHLCRAGDLAAASGARGQRWRPGLGEPMHSEIFAHGDEATGASVALALALDGMRVRQGGPLTQSDDLRSVLWVQDSAAVKLTGRPYRHGLPATLRHRVIHVEATRPEDALFALEEGVRCRDLAFVLGEIAGNPRALDFTASRRLSLAAERHGMPLWLVRINAARDLSSARMRWEVAAAPSLSSRWNAAAPGLPGWRAELFRARAHPPAEWTLRDDGQRLLAEPAARLETSAARDGDLVRAPVDRSLATG